MATDSIPIVRRLDQPMIARTLVLNPERADRTEFFRRVVELCRTLGTRPIVLTVDSSEVRAARREELARRAVGAAGGDADFDLVAGCDVKTAVTQVARIRGCSQVIVGRAEPRPWWRWPRRDPIRGLLGVSERLTLVALPG